MKAEQFNTIAEARIERCRQTLLVKGEEYSRDGDRLHNFKVAARIDDESQERALWGMAKKHIVSIRDLIMDAEQGISPTEQMLDEKITDWIGYGLLLEGCLRERMAGAPAEVVARLATALANLDTDPLPEDGASTLPAPGMLTDSLTRQVEDLGFKCGRKQDK